MDKTYCQAISQATRFSGVASASGFGVARKVLARWRREQVQHILALYDIRTLRFRGVFEGDARIADDDLGGDGHAARPAT